MRFAARKSGRRLPCARVTIALRTMVVVGALVASYVLLDARATDAACDDATQRVFATSGGFAPLAGLDPAVDDVREDCEGGFGVRQAAEIIRSASESRPALAPRAVDLAREATRLEPENYRSWLTLAAALVRSDPAAARESFERATELNPRLPAPDWLGRPKPAPR
jgi:hypothetical protein